MYSLRAVDPHSPLKRSGFCIPDISPSFLAPPTAGSRLHNGREIFRLSCSHSSPEPAVGGCNPRRPPRFPLGASSLSRGEVCEASAKMLSPLRTQYSYSLISLHIRHDRSRYSASTSPAFYSRLTLPSFFSTLFCFACSIFIYSITAVS